MGIILDQVGQQKLASMSSGRSQGVSSPRGIHGKLPVVVRSEEVAAAQVVPFVVSLVAMSFAIGILLRANGDSRGDDLVAELVVDDRQ